MRPYGSQMLDELVGLHRGGETVEADKSARNERSKSSCD